MKNIITIILIPVLLCANAVSVIAQLSEDRISDVAEIKTKRFQDILDLTKDQATQLKDETKKLMVANSKISYSKNINEQIVKNFEAYYKNLTKLKAGQLSTIKLIDALEREERKEAYESVLQAYSQSADFTEAISNYNWNIVLPILVSYRKDLDKAISVSDKALIDRARTKMLQKYELISNIRQDESYRDRKEVLEFLTKDIISDIQELGLPYLLEKYNDDIVNLRLSLSKHEKEIKQSSKDIYDQYMLDNHKSQLSAEEDFLSMIGISKMLKDSFLLLMNGDSRLESYKINALNLMITGFRVSNQF